MTSCRLLFGVLVLVVYTDDSLARIQEKGVEMPKYPRKLCGAERPKDPRNPYEWIDPLTYLDQVTSLFEKRVREHGVGKLPAPDKVYDVNTTRYKIHMEGSTDYCDGYVMGIQNITRHPRDFIWYINDKINSAIIKFKIELTNVSLFYDLRVDVDVLETQATAVLVFPKNHIEVLLQYDLNSHVARVMSMSTNSVSGPKTRFSPDSPVMQAVAYNARLTMSTSLFSDLTMWIKYPFEPILQTIVRQKKFPLKLRRGRDKRKLRMKGMKKAAPSRGPPVMATIIIKQYKKN